MKWIRIWILLNPPLGLIDSGDDRLSRSKRSVGEWKLGIDWTKVTRRTHKDLVSPKGDERPGALCLIGDNDSEFPAP